MISFFNRIISKIKVFFLKRKLNKIYGYKHGKVIRSYDSNSLYPYEMDSNWYYIDTDSVKVKREV